ncbi:helix-turn-helix transcriptional regulator [Paenibacillus xylanilyticus]|uniref:YafY family transcriptional regulator n=1 Tax=Paenibacillus xylanilyticus TaxID=248903 RepID=A0A7Y6C2H5_9BACL|nr:YafY family protein [Paenibacillus xylanilyticus]NUU79412.1 YafY family transcriptional regulator [Paenibacillus xylanilyticus]
MNKTERQLAITLELQRSKTLRAEDLATRFETSVRTIYRDIQALSEAGVPIIGAPGQGYSLMEGYFLPPVSFTAEEAVSLLMGADFIEQRLDTDYGLKAKSAQRKIEAILPESVRNESTRVRETMRLLHTVEPLTDEMIKPYLNQIRNAILERRKISFMYLKKMPGTDGTRKNKREVSPYGLTLLHENWVLIGRCDMRQDIRHFRLSRMTGLSVLEDHFLLPDGFDLSSYRPPDDRNKRVLIRANPEIADKIIEAVHFYIESIEDHKEGVNFHFRVRYPEELLHHFLGWGGDIEVIEPKSLRFRIQEVATNILKHY